MDEHSLTTLLRDQSGVISRRQLLGPGGRKATLDRLVRRRGLTAVLPGVFVDGEDAPTWLQRAWAGVLLFWPAALAGATALRAELGPGWRRYDDDGPLEIAVPSHRRVAGAEGYVVSRRLDFWGCVQWSAAPPRLRVEQAGLDLAASAGDELEMVETLADLCLTRRTTAPHLLRAMTERGSVPRRPLLSALLTDLAEGGCSVLEEGYRHRVERAHGLPVGERRPLGPWGGMLEVAYDGHERPLVVEMDGRLLHDSTRRRDPALEGALLDSAPATTLRAGWGQVFDQPCRTAELVGLALARHGWTGRATPCSSGCPCARAVAAPYVRVSGA